jgi:uncharacterized protein (DUF4415 family)
LLESDAIVEDEMARRPTGDSRWQAEQAFKAATTKPADLPAAPPAIPGVKEMVSLRIDRDVLDVFQADGPGWQDRINAALRKAAGL